MPDEQVYDSPVDWVARHVRSYVVTAGRKGHRKWSASTLLLTTRGRKTGKLRRTALIYGRDGNRYVVYDNYQAKVEREIPVVVLEPQ